MGEPRVGTEVPRREIRDPRALRALAHPVRLRIWDELVTDGPLTATELADRIGESAANCSWHLRQLAQYGYIEEAGGGTGRQRPWRIVPQVTQWGGPDEDQELAAASDAAGEMLNARDIEALRAWNAVKRSEPPEWHDASFVGRSRTWLTVDELKALGEELAAIAFRYFDRVNDPARRPPGSRPIRLVAWAIPARPLEPETTQPDSEPER